MNKKLYIVGAGGHGKVISQALVASKRTITAFLDEDNDKQGKTLMNIPILDLKATLLTRKPTNTELANGIGLGSKRKQQFNNLKRRRFKFISLSHPSSIIANDVMMEPGVQIMAGAVLQPGTMIGPNVVLNTGCRVDHDCNIEAHSFIAPGVVICGNVKIGVSTHIGAGATIIENIKT